MKPVALKVGNKLFSGNDVASAVTFSLKHVESIEQLYTKKQLQTRVKMTQAEFDEFNSLNIQYTILGVLQHVIVDKRGTKLSNLFSLKELELAQLWANYDRMHPEGTIEIIPEKKWFVRNKYEEIYLLVEGAYFKNVGEKEIAERFDTKEQAELWTNPLTEAVLLPVGDER